MVPRAAQRIESSPCCRGVVWIAIKGRLVPQSGQLLDSRRGGWTSSDRCGSQSFGSLGEVWLCYSSRREEVLYFRRREFSLIIGEVDTLDRRISGVIWLSFGTDDIRLRTGCAVSRTGCTYGRASSSCCRASAPCRHASLHTAAHRLRAAALRLRVATHLYIRPPLVLELPRFVYVLPRISTYSRASKGPLW